MIEKLYKIIEDRKSNPVHNSYTNKLFDSGYNRMAQKVGEEAVEVIIAAGRQGKKRVIEESSDLLYHLFVLLVSQGITLGEIEEELAQRHTKKTENS